MTIDSLTQAQTLSLKEVSLGEKLQTFITQLPAGAQGVTLAEMRDLIGQDSLMMFTIFLTLIFLVPVSIPGVSTLFGGAILLIGISRLFDRNLWLPHSFTKRTVATDKLRAALERALAWVHRLERISRPHRLNQFLAGGFRLINNLAFVLGAILLMAPFGFIPFSNTLPAIALLCLAIAFIQQDGVCALLGHLANITTILYFTFLIAGGGAIIYEFWQYLM